jgi:uncharacterized membrane protein YkvI
MWMDILLMMDIVLCFLALFAMITPLLIFIYLCVAITGDWLGGGKEWFINNQKYLHRKKKGGG